MGRLASDLLEETSADLRAKSIGRKVSTAANEALNFLEARDEFWKQVWISHLCQKIL